MKNLFPPLSKEIVKLINERDSVAVVTHINPDGDAVYSSLALREILKKLNKNVYLFNDGPFGRKDVKEYEGEFLKTVDKKLIKDEDLLIILDCSTEDRPGLVYQELKHLETIVIDHHSSGRPFYKKELSYIVPSSPSTTLLIDELRLALSVPLDKKIAEFLMLGFLTDSGFFHFISQEQAPDSFKKVTSFVETGLNPYELYDRLHDGKKLSDIKAVAKIIENAESYFNGKLLISYETKDIVTAERPSDDVYHSLLESDGVYAVVLIKEKEDGIEFGFRAKQNKGVDVGFIASTFGGGGHRLAAGATVKGISIEEAKKKIIEIFSSILN